ncbi:DUF2283 domain-containing protein [candidate division KSB1 bacterium]|nr:DUF2283 domain-containing protein [candidate division KSB1 bacterium]MBL7095930.1 DUF2283 domain-containing protein [candidate division KSB1 bacterium]
MKNNKLTFGYDKEVDVLYISLGKPKKGMQYLELNNNQILRVDPKTKEIVGITLIDFSKHFSGDHYFNKIPVNASFIPDEKIAHLVEKQMQSA